MILKENNFLTREELQELWEFSNQCAYRPNWGTYRILSTGNYINSGRFVHPLSHEDWDECEISRRIKEYCKEKTGKELKLDQAYINYSDPFSGTMPHTDHSVPKQKMTALLYLNEQWLWEWAGYTCFFDKYGSDEVLDTIVPAPGKMVLFDSNILHYALPPTKYAPVPRVTIALKYLITNPDEQEFIPLQL